MSKLNKLFWMFLLTFLSVWLSSCWTDNADTKSAVLATKTETVTCYFYDAKTSQKVQWTCSSWSKKCTWLGSCSISVSWSSWNSYSVTGSAWNQPVSYLYYKYSWVTKSANFYVPLYAKCWSAHGKTYSSAKDITDTMKCTDWKSSILSTSWDEIKWTCYWTSLNWNNESTYNLWCFAKLPSTWPVATLPTPQTSRYTCTTLAWACPSNVWWIIKDAYNTWIYWESNSYREVNNYDYMNAKTTCDALIIWNFTDWRLPTQNELDSLFVNLIAKPEKIFGLSTWSNYYWTSTLWLSFGQRRAISITNPTSNNNSIRETSKASVICISPASNTSVNPPVTPLPTTGTIALPPTKIECTLEGHDQTKPLFCEWAPSNSSPMPWSNPIISCSATWWTNKCIIDVKNLNIVWWTEYSFRSSNSTEVKNIKVSSDNYKVVLKSDIPATTELPTSWTVSTLPTVTTGLQCMINGWNWISCKATYTNSKNEYITLSCSNWGNVCSFENVNTPFSVNIPFWTEVKVTNNKTNETKSVILTKEFHRVDFN
jgi:hypothetical protein